MNKNMARASKLTFPLPGRKSRKDTRSRAADHSILPYETPKPSFNSGSKAQRLLGLPDLGYCHPTQNEEQSVASLHTKQGITSVIVSDVSVESSRTKHENDHRSGNKQKTTGMQQPIGERQARSSSPLPRTRFLDTSSNRDSTTDATSSTLQHSGSSSTLRSYDDLLKTSLSVSQQTSSPPTRLPKCCSPTSSPLGRDMLGKYTKAKKQSKDRKNNTQTENNSSYLRPSVFAPKSYGSKGQMSSPPKGMDSPFSLLTPPGSRQPAAASRRKWFDLNITKRKVCRSRSSESTRLESDVIHQRQLSSIIAVRTPKDKVQHWFDGLEEEGCVVSDQRTDSSEYQLQAPNPSSVIRPIPALSLIDIDKEDYYLVDRDLYFSICTRVSSFQQGSDPEQFERSPSHDELQASEVRSTSSNSTQQNGGPRRSYERLFWNNNLQKQSVLELSLSEYGGDREEKQIADAPSRCIRGSVDEPTDSDVSLHSAQQVTYSRSRPNVTEKAPMISRLNHHPDHALARDENHLSVLEQALVRSKSSLSKRHGGPKQGISHLDLESNTTSSDTHSSSPQTYWPTLQSRNEEKLLVAGQPRRVIAVTEDEVHQLEALRLKSTSTRSKASGSYSIFPPDNAENRIVRGWNTADSDPHKSVHGADMSNFPSPPSLASTKIYGRSLRANSTTSISPNKLLASSSSLETFIYITDYGAKPRLSPSVQFDPPLPSPSISMASIMTP